MAKNEKDDERAEIEAIGASEWSHRDYGLDEKEAGTIKGFDLIIDYLQNTARQPRPPFLGYAFFVAALNTDIVLNFTREMGACTKMYWGYVFQMPKWNFNVAKVSESMEISPVHADAYNLMAGQRQRIEGQIKQGLQSAAQSVTDFELLAHDARRYKEILDYFKEEKVRGDEHVLRSMFIDRVDAHTGEGYSMITMAKRWPTIITDFIRMGKKEYKGKEWTSEDVVRKLDVSQAEATVLITKDRLFKEWKRLFRPTVAERYSRMQAMVDARKQSIDEYKTWLRPYVIKHRLMKEMTESGGGNFATNPHTVPAFGAQYAFSGVRLWVWKAFSLSEKRKPHAATETEIDGVRWIIDPLDDFVREWARKIEFKYSLEPEYYDDKRIRGLLKGWATKKSPLQAEAPVLKMVPSELYYALFDLKFERGVIRVPPPAGGEMEDLTINPLRTWIVSQNVILIHLLELNAKERTFENELDRMLGTKSIEDRYLRESKNLLLGEPEKREVKGNPAKRFVTRIDNSYGALKRKVSPLSRYFFRPGPYESSFYERVVKLYLVEVGGLYGQQVNFWKARAGVG